MIRARPGLAASFRQSGSLSHQKGERREWVGGQQINLKPEEYVSHMVIEAWDDDGDPLVLGKKGLVLAASFSNFIGIAERGDDRIGSVSPPGGWIAWRYEDSGKPWASPLIGWGLTDDGSVVPLETDSNGFVDKPDSEAVLRHESDGPPPNKAPQTEAP